ncbi:MAG: fibronectin type III domain-containing protein [Bacteroidales bacterium]|nr:fibronectin type III domain-containing protein [Bacteroidales bacterium]
MKKTIFFAGAMMLLASVACNKETQTDNQPSVELKPQVTLSFNAALTTPTKTEIGNSETADGVTVHEIYWSKDDKIAVYPHDPESNSGVAGVEFTSEDLVETAAAEAVFTGEIDAADAYYAFYPTAAGAKWVGSYSDFSVTLPSEQVANGIASGFAVANVTGTETVTFEHVCGFVKFTIDETYAGKIKEVKFSGKNSEALAGKLYVYPDDMSKNKIDDDKASVLTLTPSSGETFAAGTYYFTCFPVNLTGGLELTFVDTDDKEAVKSSDTAANIEREGVLNLGTVANLEFESVTPPLADGTYVILAKQNDIYYAMKSTHESNSSRLDEVEFDINADETHIASAVWNLKNIEGAKYEITNSNQYLTAENANNANVEEAETEMKIVDNGDGTYQVIDVVTLRNLSRNNASSGFAFYATTSQNYNLYLKAVTYVYMPELQAPVISVTGNNEDKSITVTWTDVDNATSYEVVCGENTQTVNKGVQTCTLTMDAYTTYDVTVTAKADGYVSATSESSSVTLKDPTDNTAWTLVTSTSQLQANDQIIIAAAEYDVAISTTQNTNNRSQATVTKEGDNVTLTTDVQILTLEVGAEDGTFAFNTGDGYLYAASSSKNYMKTQTTKDANASWLVTIDDSNIASIVAQGTNTRNTLQYNSSSSLFSCYGSASQKAVVIYKKTVN